MPNSLRKLLRFFRLPIFEKVQRLIWLYYKVRTKLLYKPFCRAMGSSVIIIKPIKITPKTIMFGDNVTIMHHGRIEGVTQYEGKKFSPNIIFEDGVSVQQNLHLTCANKIVIGKNTAIAANVSITDIHHAYDDISMPIEKQNIQVSRVAIGEDCKIYNNAVILPGVVIGKHVTIGANCVVGINVPDYCVVVGVPARIVKQYSFDKKQWLTTNADGSFKKKRGLASGDGNLK